LAWAATAAAAAGAPFLASMPGWLPQQQEQQPLLPPHAFQFCLEVAWQLDTELCTQGMTRGFGGA